MSNLPADPSVPSATPDAWLPGPQRPGEGWSRRKFFAILFLVILLHVALIFLIGTKRRTVSRPVANVPHLNLVNANDELIALSDPTLFARPNAHDVVSEFWRRMPPPAQPNFSRPEAPRYLTVPPDSFGGAFHDLAEATRPAAFESDFKPAPQVIAPDVVLDEPAPATTMKISGALAQRRLLVTNELPSLPLNDVIPPSRVRALVDAAGNVFSTIVLGSNPNLVLEGNPNHAADLLALQFVGQLRFAPGPDLTFGQVTIYWHTVPTNSVPAPKP